MNILIATGIFPPDIGGPATYSKILAEELLKRGHNITIVTYGDIAIFKKIPSSKFQIRNVSRKIPKGLRHVVYFWNVLRYGRRADIIYAQDAVSAGFPAAIASMILWKKFILKIVGDHAWEQGMQRFGVADLLDDFLKNSYGFHVGLLRFVQTHVASRAYHIIVPSVYLKSVVEQWGVSSQKIVVVPNAVSIVPISISKKEAREKLGLYGFVLLSVGRLVPWKGFSMLIELMPQIRAKVQDVKLVIVGDGPEKDRLESRIKNYELEESVISIGSVPKGLLALYLSAADIFLLNTGYEGFSHQLIEAMAMGMPIVTTSAGGNKEVVRDGENALVARFNDFADWEEKIIKLHADKKLCAQLVSANKDIINRYSIESMIIKTESIILDS